MKKQIDSVGRPEIIVNQEAYRDQEYEGIPLINRRKTRAPYETIETYDNGEKVILRNAMTDETNPLDDVGMHHFLEEVEIEKVKEKKGDKKGDKKAPPVKEKETTIKLKRKQIKEGYEESGVDIETYNKYTGGSSDKTVDEVIVGVAGSDSPVMIDTDWYQNFDSRRTADTITETTVEGRYLKQNGEHDFESYGKLSTDKLEQLATKKILGLATSKQKYALYELQMRRASTTLAEVHKTGIPITIQGDSKGGEDSAYLTLKTVSNIKKEEKKEIKDMNIHLSVINPKQVRFNKESKKMLEELAKENKITVEKVYPEVLSKGIATNQDGFDIPAGTMIITVPNERSLITNHKVGAYDSNVLSGVNGEYSFHNVETVYGDMEKAKKLYPKMKTQFIEGKKVAAVYEYTINQVRHKSGIVMSVSDYFFIEQQEQLSVISDSLSTCAEKVGGYIENAVLRNPGVLSYGGQTLGVLQTENILESYRKVSDASKESLKSIQEEYITNFVIQGSYISKYKERARKEYLEAGHDLDKITTEDINETLISQFYEEAHEHVEHKSQFYTEKIIKKVTPSIKSYEKKVDNLKEIVLSHQNELIEVSESIELQRRELETATGEAKDKIQMKITRIINIQNKG